MRPLWALIRLQFGVSEQGEFVCLSKDLGGTIREALGSPRKAEAAQRRQAKGFVRRGGGGGRLEDGFLCERLSLERKVFLNAPLDDPIRSWQMDITGTLLIHGKLQLLSLPPPPPFYSF